MAYSRNSRGRGRGRRFGSRGRRRGGRRGGRRLRTYSVSRGGIRL